MKARGGPGSYPFANLICTMGLRCLLMHFFGPQAFPSPKQASPLSTRDSSRPLSTLLPSMRSQTGNAKANSLCLASMASRMALEPLQEKRLCERCISTGKLVREQLLSQLAIAIALVSSRLHLKALSRRTLHWYSCSTSNSDEKLAESTLTPDTSMFDQVHAPRSN